MEWMPPLVASTPSVYYAAFQNYVIPDWSALKLTPYEVVYKSYSID